LWSGLDFNTASPVVPAFLFLLNSFQEYGFHSIGIAAWD